MCDQKQFKIPSAPSDAASLALSASLRRREALREGVEVLRGSTGGTEARRLPVVTQVTAVSLCQDTTLICPYIENCEDRLCILKSAEEYAIKDNTLKIVMEKGYTLTLVWFNVILNLG